MMLSRERYLNAIRRQPVDHVPLYLRLWSMGEGPDHIPFAWQEQVSRVENLLRLGLDDTLLLQPPLGYTEEYKADAVPGLISWVERIPPGGPGEYPRLKKTYHTPEGDLTQVVKVTEDWPHGDQIMLFSDFNIPRHIEPLVKNLEDARRVHYLLAEPDAGALAEFCAQAQTLHLEAERLGVALDGGWTALGDSAVWLCGMENVLTWQMEQPEILETVLDALVEWELRRMDWLLKEGVDVMVHMAWYEGTDFWTPKNYRRMLKPRLQKLVERSHAAGVPFRYIITKGWKPLRKDLIELGVDCITGVDPVQDNIVLEDIKADPGGQTCLMGGINSAVMLTQWTEAEIRSAVDRALAVMAPGGGFILFPVDNVSCEFLWERVEIIVDQWKKYW